MMNDCLQMEMIPNWNIAIDSYYAIILFPLIPENSLIWYDILQIHPKTLNKNY